MSLDITYDEDRAEAVVEPEHGRRVVFVVERRKITVGRDTWGARRVEARWVVALRGGTGDGFSSHTSYDTACKALLRRARSYDRAYSVPRGVRRAAA